LIVSGLPVPTRVDAKLGDHFLQPDSPVLIQERVSVVVKHRLLRSQALA